jgi:hypothetical protein
LNRLMGTLRKELINPLTQRLDKVEGAQKTSADKADSVLAKLEEELSGTLEALGIAEDEPEPEPEPANESTGEPTLGLQGNAQATFLAKQYDKRIAALEKTVAEKDRIAKEAEERRRDAERTRLLTQALQVVKAHDPRNAVKILADNVRWDDEKQQHVFVTGEGAAFPMTDDRFDDFAVAVKETLPAYMLQATAAGGGAGSQSPRIADRLSHAKQSVDDARKQAQADPRSDMAMAAVLRANREAKQVEAEAVTGRGGTRS